MLFYYTPEWHEIVFLRASHYFLEKNLCLATRDKCLKCFSSLGEKCSITRKRCWWIVGIVKQRSLSHYLPVPPFAPPKHHTICVAHAALHGWPAYLAGTSSKSLLELIWYVGRLRLCSPPIYRGELLITHVAVLCTGDDSPTQIASSREAIHPGFQEICRLLFLEYRKDLA